MLAKGFGGAERSFVDICHALADKGHEVSAICESRGMAKSYLRNIKIHPVTVFSHWDPFAFRAIKKILCHDKPDIVHTHLARAAKLAGEAAHGAHIPSLVKTHNYVNLKYYRYIDCFVPTTNDQRAYLLRNNIAAAKIQRIPNFTSLDLADAPKRLDSTKRLKILGIGRLVAKKGFDLLIRAVKDLCDLQKIELIIVGDGDQKSSLMALTRSLKIEQFVKFHGWQNDVSTHLESADLFVLPSRDEPFGIVCLEAMAKGLPIVATATQGPREILDEETALLVPPENVEALKVAINTVLTQPSEAEQRARNALNLCRRHYTKDIVVEKYLALYKQLIN